MNLTRLEDAWDLKVDSKGDVLCAGSLPPLLPLREIGEGP